MTDDARPPATLKPGITALAPYTLWFVLGYFVIRVVSRVLVSPSLEADEAEQMILCQTLAWGYGGQPPLYTWLQISLFQVFGTNIFAMTLLKNALLGATLAVMFVTTKRITKDDLTAAMATVGLFLLPGWSWEAQRDLSHTVLVVLAAVLTLHALVNVIERGRTRDFALLGVAWAIGFLSKHNFALVAASMLIAAATMTAFRGPVFRWGLLLSVVLCVVLLAPSTHWALTNRTEALSKVDKFEIGETNDSGFVALFRSAAAVIAVLAAIYAAALFRSPQRGRASGRPRDYGRLLARTMVVALILAAIGAVVAGVTTVRQRWLLPVFVLLPIALAIFARPKLTTWRVRAVIDLSLVFALGLLVFLPMRTVIGPLFGSHCRLNIPYVALAEEIRKEGFDGGLITCPDGRVAGNMLMRFPGSVAHVPEYPNPPVAPGTPELVVWSTRKQDHDLPPIDPAAVRRAQAPHLYGGVETELLLFVVR